ncbi:hypothetical protein HYV74_04830 [Candidatus Uhrbacteria bacterium]|nr:hypothetical protein [Candidatus Uhrbacteria bacterium]
MATAHARRQPKPSELSRPRISWDELRDRYRRYGDYESRIGFIHASRSAEIPWNGTCSPVQHTHERLLQMAGFLTEIGSETDIQEPDRRLREAARTTLARYGLEPITEWHHKYYRSRLDKDDHVGAMSAAIINAKQHLTAFYAATEQHVRGLGSQDLTKVQQFLEQRLRQGVRARDRDCATQEILRMPGDTSEPDEAIAFRALVHARGFACLGNGDHDAVPLLYQWLAEHVRGIWPHKKFSDGLTWFPEGRSPLEITTLLTLPPHGTQLTIADAARGVLKQRNSFEVDQHRILALCAEVGGSQDHDITACAQALIRILASIHHQIASDQEWV